LLSFFAQLLFLCLPSRFLALAAPFLEEYNSEDASIGENRSISCSFAIGIVIRPYVSLASSFHQLTRNKSLILKMLYPFWKS
jgi:hypothetical protein